MCEQQSESQYLNIDLAVNDTLTIGDLQISVQEIIHNCGYPEEAIISIDTDSAGKAIIKDDSGIEDVIKVITYEV